MLKKNHVSHASVQFPYRFNAVAPNPQLRASSRYMHVCPYLCIWWKLLLLRKPANITKCSVLFRGPIYRHAAFGVATVSLKMYALNNADSLGGNVNRWCGVVRHNTIIKCSSFCSTSLQQKLLEREKKKKLRCYTLWDHMLMHLDPQCGS
ncbi:hypothetical protein, unlikely [Trypanosoma congolense IL3000]|uniref:Uncharacterized protein n=1 Tax=Trypanosoma congolense (strain IL3000) TaxID=1068625 RepID=F9W4R1_TRYCI|nr:hypothetical protein, unlikely [Trypanosoma congolense IL3000]